MCYMIAESGDCPFLQINYASHAGVPRTHSPTLPRHEITRAAAIDAFEERYVLHLPERMQHKLSKGARLSVIDHNLYSVMKKRGIACKE
jgi:hypothetical protein